MHYTQILTTIKKLSTHLFAFSLATLPIYQANAEQPPTIYGYALEYRLSADGKDQYNKMFDAFREHGLEFELKISPFKRVARKFLTEKHPICAFPTSKNAINKSSPEIRALPLIFSDSVDQISLRVFTRPDSPKISDMEQLKGKTVAIWNGLDPELFLKDMGAVIETTPNELIRVKMLDAHRIDAILGFTPDVVLAAQKLQLPIPHFHEDLALFRDEGASLVCKDSPANRKLIDRFNGILKTIKNNGNLKEILGPYVEIAI